MEQIRLKKDQIIKLKFYLNKNNFLVKENIGNISLQAKKDSYSINWYETTERISFMGNWKEDEKIKLINEINKIKGVEIENDTSVSETILNTKTGSKSIYIVHGRDRESLLELQLFLTNLNLKPIISKEREAGGLSILDGVIRDIKETSFAFVLLTPDDLGYQKSLGMETKKYRARQNVIFEMGVLYGKMKKDRIMLLVKDEIEIPTDINGMIYKKYNNEIKEIESDIIQELKNAEIL
ncbi:nucleotide-binding protein [Mycoplasmopsis cynos]|uniref:nucleotide-binding protein n=1 Tax=Mycoplasmopsis cynos TaxID=171284 RepID=UPI002AFDFDE8|nr:nucleotide-binding protein [Mycoplasmopsis cynos]WQQ12919.1 nucleotide-binding protein [Mycoplasmopsis cynos]WQQ13300.1 nucleotide-binding protein [Mycoplasmopsis cynos]WQQ13576.1 nucleotide-binding protein [Mycoplasmopsis cynos]WQQ13808.1 nucleotide-binding protein [Mycoplasmopsis cynos]WQQ16423.1 nucleotide-binding protein [Mycoplasmopsis cynos]